MNSAGRPVVVALGGNAIARPGDDGTIGAQYLRAAEAMARIADLITAGRQVVVTHGNGPVIGSIVLRGELASGEVPPMPLYINDADSAGGIGLMLQQTLGNELRRRGTSTCVATVICQVVVDARDAAFSHPTKPIGMFYSQGAANRLRAERGWTMDIQPDGRYRRVVASPRPLRVVECDAVAAMLAAGVVPVAAGGGGVPVTESADGVLTGTDAVVDKDWSSALVACSLDAEALVICMEADALYRAWGTDRAERIDRINCQQAAELLSSGTLAAGSIAPKVAAAREFALSTGRHAVLCATENLATALEGCSGTLVTP